MSLYFGAFDIVRSNKDGIGGFLYGRDSKAGVSRSWTLELLSGSQDASKVVNFTGRSLGRAGATENVEAKATLLRWLYSCGSTQVERCGGHLASCNDSQINLLQRKRVM